MSRKQIDDHLFGPGPKRILSLDGGGVHGLATLGMLKRVETLLAARSTRPGEFRLSDYFDLIGGTSTGAVIATLLAMGFKVERIIALYKDFCPEIFGKRRKKNLVLMGSKFDSDKFRKIVNKTFDDILKEMNFGHLLSDSKQPTLQSEVLQTGLAIFAKRIEKPSVWVFCNNPKSKYWSHQTPEWKKYFSKSKPFYPNADYSLRDVVRASASAPYYLDAVELQIDPEQRGMFLDGGVSPHNNPCTELFLMTAMNAHGAGGNGDGVSPFGFSWRTGADKLFMLSLGTGSWRDIRTPEEYGDSWFANKPIIALSSIIRDCQISATTWMQAISKVTAGEFINYNLDDMSGLRILDEPLLTFRRVNPKFEKDWLESLGERFALSDKKLTQLRDFDRASRGGWNMDLLLEIGLATGERDISDHDFPSAFDLPEWNTMKTPPTKRIVVGVTGHRPNRLPRSFDSITAGLESALDEIQLEWPYRKYVLLSGLAEGADRLAAEAALRRGWQLDAVLPFSKQRYLQDFETEASKADFERLLAASNKVFELSSGDRFQGAHLANAYAALGDELVERCDAIIAIWDGKPAQGKGGTVDVMASALYAHIPVYWINAADDVPPRLLRESDLPA
jgi:predicted acylesterase/phospholipase RssA